MELKGLNWFPMQHGCSCTDTKRVLVIQKLVKENRKVNRTYGKALSGPMSDPQRYLIC